MLILLPGGRDYIRLGEKTYLTGLLCSTAILYGIGVLGVVTSAAESSQGS